MKMKGRLMLLVMLVVAVALGAVSYYGIGEDGQMSAAQIKQGLDLSGGVDIVLAHSPIRGYGDGEDYAHQGFSSLLRLVDKHQPKYLIHGHVHANYGANLPRVLRRGETTIINAYERFLLDTENPPQPDL